MYSTYVKRITWSKPQTNPEKWLNNVFLSTFPDNFEQTDVLNLKSNFRNEPRRYKNGNLTR